MGISDRRYDDDRGWGGRGGGFRDAMRRMFTEGDFFSWSFHLFTAFGIRVRIHLLFVLFIAFELIASAIRQDAGVFGFKYTLLVVGALWLTVLLHEFGHCFACRWVGGEADEILMWPLGGLAMAAPPHDWKASFITTAGGPAVNVVLWPLLGAAVYAASGSWDAVIFNPFDPGWAIVHAGIDSWWKVGLWSVYYTNIILLGFNVLLPMFPLDGGRMVQELLWWRLGYKRSMVIATNLGLFAAIALGVFALVTNESILIGIALFAGFTCYAQRRNLEFLEEGIPGYDFSRGYRGMPGGGGGGGSRAVRESGPSRAEQRKYKEALKRQQREQQEQAEVDRILAKIAASGMDSLTRAERRTLERATENKRRRG